MVVATDAIVITMPDTLILLCLFILIFRYYSYLPHHAYYCPFRVCFILLLLLSGMIHDDDDDVPGGAEGCCQGYRCCRVRFGRRVMCLWVL
jgi:hypothetical protein